MKRCCEHHGELLLPHFLMARVLPLLGRYGYGALLPIAVFEGPAMAMIAGALVATGQMNPWVAGPLLIGADLVGDAAYYGLGRFGHAPLLRQISKRLKFTEERLRPLEQRFRDNDWKLIILGKTQALGSIILYFAGASRMPFLRYMALNLAGTVPKVVLFGLAGYLLARGILHSTKYVDYVTVTLFGATFLLLVIYMLASRYLLKGAVQDVST
jgi:membrane protein DedA with SNARE-associated domain